MVSKCHKKSTKISRWYVYRKSICMYIFVRFRFLLNPCWGRRPKDYAVSGNVDAVGGDSLQVARAAPVRDGKNSGFRSRGEGGGQGTGGGEGGASEEDRLQSEEEEGRAGSGGGELRRHVFDTLFLRYSFQYVAHGECHTYYTYYACWNMWARISWRLALCIAKCLARFFECTLPQYAVCKSVPIYKLYSTTVYR